jgi:ribosomal peptide maturation radical SAM protein 1
MNKHYDVVLAVLPWAPIDSPSIQLGLLKSVLKKESISTTTAHINVAFFKFLRDRNIAADIAAIAHSHDSIKDLSPISPWLFAVPPVFNDTNTITAHFNQSKKQLNGEDLKKFDMMMSLRELVPRFLTECAENILACTPKAVGFSCTFDQRTPSLVLAKMLKQQNENLKIVFGGTYMDGIMGETFIRAFPWVDVVVRGDGEKIVAKLFRNLCSNNAEIIDQQPGLCIRNSGKVKVYAESSATKADPKELPLPDYDEYFALIEDTDLINPENVRIAMETSRGCWWFKYKCKFCGRSEENLQYRTKGLEQVALEMLTQSERYQQVDFMIVDPAIQGNFIAKLMQGLKEEHLDFSVWCQSRVKFKKETLAAMANSGVDTIFMGIESLSTPVLKLMRKGHTALDAIEVLKWGQESGISITWNMIFNVPGEKSTYYEQMADLMKSLTHLHPPFNLISLDFCRSSVYFEEAKEYGIELLDPEPMHDPIFHLALTVDNDIPIRNLAGKLKAQYTQTDQTIINLCRESLKHWKANYSLNMGKLAYRQGQGFLNIYDQRSGLPQEVYTLGLPESKIYLACNSPKSVDEVWMSLDDDDKLGLNKEEVKEFLDMVTQNRLTYEENGKYLSLAISQSQFQGYK